MHSNNSNTQQLTNADALQVKPPANHGKGEFMVFQAAARPVGVAQVQQTTSQVQGPDALLAACCWCCCCCRCHDTPDHGLLVCPGRLYPLCMEMACPSTLELCHPPATCIHMHAFICCCFAAVTLNCAFLCYLTCPHAEHTVLRISAGAEKHTWHVGCSSSCCRGPLRMLAAVHA